MDSNRDNHWSKCSCHRVKIFQTVTQISDSGGVIAGNVTAGVINKEVQNIVSTDKAFASLKDGSVVAWGDSTDGGYFSRLERLLWGTPTQVLLLLFLHLVVRFRRSKIF